MPNKTPIKISEINQLFDRMSAINRIDLMEIEFVDDNGKIIQISQKIIEDFKYTGLNNVDFIITDFYKKGFDESR